MVRLKKLLDLGRKYMKYDCVIKKIEEEEVIVVIKGLELACFCNTGTVLNEGDETVCELSFYGDYEFDRYYGEKSILRNADTYSYTIAGVLDVDQKVLGSVIDFSLEESDLWDVGYLDGQMVFITVDRIDIDFDIQGIYEKD